MNTTAESVTDSIRRAISRRHAEMIRFVEDLIRIPTENPPGANYEACIGAIGNKLGELGLEYLIHQLPDDSEDDTCPRFWLESQYGDGPGTLYFHGHYDVVPASDQRQFEPHVSMGNLFGRGSSDMKGGLVSMIYAIRALMDCGIAPEGRIGLVIVPDEETGGQRGSHALDEAGIIGRNGVGMLTAEPTGGVVWNACRGAISARVTIKGRPAHVGLHYRGVNAFEGMLDVAKAMRAIEQNVSARKTSFRIQPEAARRSILMIGGQSGGGDNFNLVPGECFFTIDRRINPEEDLAAEKQRLLDELTRLRSRGIDLDVEVFQEAHPAGVTEDNAAGRALSESIESVTGEPAQFEMCPGLLETRFYSRRSVPAFAYGPGLLSVSHGPSEFIKLKDLYAATNVYALTAVRLFETGTESGVGCARPASE